MNSTTTRNLKYLILFTAALAALPMQAGSKQKKKHHNSHPTRTSHTFSLGTMDSTFLVNNTPPINILSSIQVSGKCVDLTIPSFTFTIPESSLTPRDGFAYTVPSTNLPKSVWHSKGLPYSIPCASNCTLYVFNDGAIVIGGAAFQPLIAGTYTVNKTTIRYVLDKDCHIPTNFKIADTVANVAQYPATTDLLEYYNNDFYEDVIAYTWAANPPNDTTNSININMYGVVGTVSKGQVTFGPVQALFKPDNQPLFQRCLENSISINPKNKKNIVATTRFHDANFPLPSFEQRTLVRSYTFDGGNSWTTSKITGNTAHFGLPNFRADPCGQFDEFGNYWVIYLEAGTPDLNPPFEVVVAVSTDGGVSFTTAGKTALSVFLDYPRMAFGGDGKGGKALWFFADYIKDNILSDGIIGYIQVSGLGSYGPLTYDLATGLGKDVATNSRAYLQVPEISVTPDGDVFLLGVTQIVDRDNANYTKYVFAKHTGGISNFQSFQTPTDLFISNVGNNNISGCSATGGKVYPFAPKRGTSGRACRGIDYDAQCKRLWIGGNNIKPNNFDPCVDTSPGAHYDMSIFAMFSDDKGKTWSSQKMVSDLETGPRALPSLKVNQKTGEKAFFWYDARDDASGKTAKPFGAIFK